MSQYIDATSVYTALEQAIEAAEPFKGSMFWREVKGHQYMIKMSASGSQKSLGVLTDKNKDTPQTFMMKKKEAQDRVDSLKAELKTQQKINRALGVGRVPAIVIDTLNAIKSAGLTDHFIVVGTHALYAYESAAGVLIPNDALATQDIDLLFDTRKRVKFFTQMKQLDSSFLAVLQKADKTFKLRDDQRYTAINDKGFEVDVVRRMAADIDPHPLRMSDVEDDFWAVQISQGSKLLGSKPFQQAVVSSTGTIAMMKTIHPLDFIRLKTILGSSPSRDALKAPKDLLQARLVTELVQDYLPHLIKEANMQVETSRSHRGSHRG